jgi:hypothetical protein
VLGGLWTLWGAFGALAGLSLGMIATGTYVAATRAEGAARVLPTLGLLFGTGTLLAVAGLAMMLTGRRLLARSARGRLAALLCALPNLLLVPFGTALGVYTWWVLLNDDARREFRARGQPCPPPPPSTSYNQGHEHSD